MSVITVFGGSGGIGRQVVNVLAKDGHQVRVAVRNPEAALFLKSMGDVGQITPVQANVRDGASVRSALMNVDAAINLVGILYEGGAQQFDSVHVEGAANIARAASDSNCERLVHISAIGASGSSKSAYARSKNSGESAIMRAFPKASILRPSIVFGPHDQFFNRFAAMAQLPLPLPVFGCGLPRLTTEGIKLFGHGGTRFQPVYVGDVAEAIVACLNRNDAPGKLFELGGPHVYNFCEIMEMVLRETKRRRILVPIPHNIAMIIGFFSELLPKPILTRDQVRQLANDNILSGTEATFTDLGIEPKPVEVIVPGYLETYRRGGRYTGT